MKIEKKTVLITGANRGIGLALVNEALRRGRSGYTRASFSAHTLDEGSVTFTNSSSYSLFR